MKKHSEYLEELAKIIHKQSIKSCSHDKFKIVIAHYFLDNNLVIVDKDLTPNRE